MTEIIRIFQQFCATILWCQHSLLRLLLCIVFITSCSVFDKTNSAGSQIGASLIKSENDQRSYRRLTLTNDLDVLLISDPNTDKAAVAIDLYMGSYQNTEQTEGLAHFLEHMAFKGTARRSSVQIAEAIEDVGGYINAYTSREMTAYYARVLQSDVPLALDVISDIVLNSVFDPAEIEVERGVILSEIGQALDTPDDIIFDWLQEVSYPGQAMGRSILGPEERVAQFQRTDLSQFVREHYSPDQMVLAAAGAVDHAAILRQCEDIFGDLTARVQALVTPAPFKGGDIRRVKDLEQAHFALSCESQTYKDHDIYAAQIFS